MNCVSVAFRNFTVPFTFSSSKRFPHIPGMSVTERLISVLERTFEALSMSSKVVHFLTYFNISSDHVSAHRYKLVNHA
jgi:hypothetical protein